jgi:hypothetical protein
MSVNSKEITFLGTDGLTVINEVDAELFGSGDLASRPVSGTASGDFYIVIDTTNQLYRIDIWDGSNWQHSQGDPVGAAGGGAHGDILYRDASVWTNLAAGTSGQYLQTNGAGSAPSWVDIAITPASSIQEATALTTETSTTDVLMDSMTVTPAAGTYAVFFGAEMAMSKKSESVFISIYVDGVQEAASEREFEAYANNAALSGTTFARVTVNGAQAIEGQWRVTANTASALGRQLLIVEVG